MSRNNSFSFGEEYPLVIKRDTRTSFLTLLNTMHDTLKNYLKDAQLARYQPSFLGESSKGLNNQKDIVDNTLIQLRQLGKSSKDLTWEVALQQLGHILLGAKFQSLMFYITTGVRPVLLDKTIDSCISRFVNQTIKINIDGDIKKLFQSLLVLHHAQATKQLFDNYFEKSMATCQNHNNDELTLAALHRFHAQLDDCSKAFKDGMNQLTPGLLDTATQPVVSPDLLPQMKAFLDEQRSKIIGLEPASSDLKIPAVSNMYTWGITAVSKLGAYVRNLNDQFVEVLASNLSIK